MPYPPELDTRFRVPEFGAALAALPPPGAPPAALAADEAHWCKVRQLYRASDVLVNLEHGFWGAMAEPVLATFRYWTERINHEHTLAIRRHWVAAEAAVRDTLAQALRCGSDELALTRGATEAMQALIGGYNRLQPGDVVISSNLDYPAMRDAMHWLRERRGAVPVEIEVPDAPSHEAVLAAYEDALRRHPRTRLVLLTHLSHYTGLVLPVRELAARIRAAGADVVVDAAHSWGQLDFGISDLDVAFAGFNLHKWIGAPLGCGALYIRRDRIGAIDPDHGTPDPAGPSVAARIRTGSPAFAAWLTLPAALELHQRIGAAHKEARLRHLRNHWVAAARALPGVQVLTPDDPAQVAGITSLRIAGHRATEVVEALAERHGVLTVAPSGGTGRPGDDAVRVTPAVHSTLQDLDALVAGLRAIAGGLAPSPACARGLA